MGEKEMLMGFSFIKKEASASSLYELNHNKDALSAQFPLSHTYVHTHALNTV